MNTKPDHISQKDWNAVDIPDMGDAPTSNRFRSSSTTPQEIVDDVTRHFRGQQKKATRIATTIRLPGEVIDFFKRGGKGWQTRLSNTLEEYVRAHNPR